MVESGIHSQSQLSLPPPHQYAKARFSGSSFGNNYAEQTVSLPVVDPRRDGYNQMSPSSMSKYTEEDDVPSLPKIVAPLRPNRNRPAPSPDVEMDSMNPSAIRLTEGNLSQHNLRVGNVNPMVHNFTSPIGMPYSVHILLHHFLIRHYLDLMYQPALGNLARANGSRLTFTAP